MWRSTISTSSSTPAGAVAGYLKFKEKGEAPERHTGAIFPKDEAPSRASLGDTDQSEWAIGKFSGEPEDPWTPVIELPLRHQETGEEYILTCQSQDGDWCCEGSVRAAPASAGWT